MADWLSPNYLEYVRESQCCVCGGHFPDAHHEAIFTSSSRKRKNDFQALPLCHIDCHLEGVHREGPSFWEDRGLKPAELVLTFLVGYSATLNPSKFDTSELFQEEQDALDYFIGVLNGT